VACVRVIVVVSFGYAVVVLIGAVLEGVTVVAALVAVSTGTELVEFSTGATLAVVVADVRLAVVSTRAVVVKICICVVVAMTSAGTGASTTAQGDSELSNHAFQGHAAASDTVGYEMVNFSLTSSPVNASQAAKRAVPVPLPASTTASTSNTVRK